MTTKRAAAVRLKPHWFHILVALADEDRHGSGIEREVYRQSDGTIRLWPAMLYGSLERLAAAGLVEDLGRLGAHPDGESERRRYYRITPHGRRAVAAEAERLAALATRARRKLAPRGRPA